MTQLTLFDRPPAIELRDPSVKPKDVRRLKGQCRDILKRLILGNATAPELAMMSLKYGGRISDLRKAGCVITHVDNDSGPDFYRLDHYPEGLIGGEG